MLNTLSELSFGQWIIIITTILYFMAAISFAMERNYGLTLCYFCYALANFGLYLTTKGI